MAVLYSVRPDGDGVEELIIEGLDILSMKDGESYRYFDMNGATGSSIRGFAPCEKGVFEMYTDEIFRMCQYNYYRANPESAEFLTGVVYDTKTDKWYRSLDGGTETHSPSRKRKPEASWTPIHRRKYSGFRW